MKKKRVVMARIVKLEESNDGWDTRFWQKCGVNSRFSAAWEMIGDFYKLRGKNGFQPRLQRHIENLKHI